MTGARNSWNVNIADVGKPGSTATGTGRGDLRITARQSGLPGLSATPWATIPGLAHLVDDPVREVAGPLRRAARSGAPRRRRARRSSAVRAVPVVRHDPERDRLAPQLADGVGQDGRVRSRGPARAGSAGPAGPARPRWTGSPPAAGGRPPPGPPRSRRARPSRGRSSTSPARSTDSPRPTSVPAKLTFPPGATGRVRISPPPSTVGVLDHHHGVGPAGQHAAGGDGGRRPGFDRVPAGRRPSAITSSVQAQSRRASPRRPRRCRRPGRRSRPRWSGRTPGTSTRRRHVLGQHPAQRRGQRDRFRFERGQVEAARNRRSASSRSMTSGTGSGGKRRSCGRSRTGGPSPARPARSPRGRGGPARTRRPSPSC